MTQVPNFGKPARLRGIVLRRRVSRAGGAGAAAVGAPGNKMHGIMEMHNECTQRTTRGKRRDTVRTQQSLAMK